MSPCCIRNCGNAADAATAAPRTPSCPPLSPCHSAPWLWLEVDAHEEEVAPLLQGLLEPQAPVGGRAPTLHKLARDHNLGPFCPFGQSLQDVRQQTIVHDHHLHQGIPFVDCVSDAHQHQLGVLGFLLLQPPALLVLECQGGLLLLHCRGDHWLVFPQGLVTRGAALRRDVRAHDPQHPLVASHLLVLQGIVAVTAALQQLRLQNILLGLPSCECNCVLDLLGSHGLEHPHLKTRSIPEVLDGQGCLLLLLLRLLLGGHPGLLPLLLGSLVVLVLEVPRVGVVREVRVHEEDLLGLPNSLAVVKAGVAAILCLASQLAILKDVGPADPPGKCPLRLQPVGCCREAQGHGQVCLVQAIHLHGHFARLVLPPLGLRLGHHEGEGLHLPRRRDLLGRRPGPERSRGRAGGSGRGCRRLRGRGRRLRRHRRRWGLQ
mmetsp:Transcript_112246/g.312366  ORF Transcript_112246/g.312366 Transcript_112246/m.312366 type:complete len:432 (-) Transcript_112246:40-1335(-)